MRKWKEGNVELNLGWICCKRKEKFFFYIMGHNATKIISRDLLYSTNDMRSICSMDVAFSLWILD
jgi:hypothetical protein